MISKTSETIDTIGQNTPLIFFLEGGPGVTSLYANMMEFGPMILDSNGKIVQNKFSLNNLAFMVFVDAPFGVGLSQPHEPNAGAIPDLANYFINFVSNFYKTFPTLAN